MEDYDDVSHDSDSDVESPARMTGLTGGGQTTGQLASRQMKPVDTVLFEQYDRNANPAVVPIQVEPGVINFDSISPGILYVMTFSVRNSSFTGQRIRIKAPASMYFALNYTPTGIIAPGIELRAEIECQIPDSNKESRFMDKIVISMGEHKLEVPLIATRHFPRISFDPFVNLGYTSEGQVVNQKVKLFNEDHELEGHVTLLPKEDSRIMMDNHKLVIKPRESLLVNLGFEGQDLGPYRELIEVQTEGAFESQYLDCSVQTVDQKLTLLADNNGGILESLSFGSLFYGEEKSLKGFLVNTGPQQLSFSISYHDEDADGALKDPDEAKVLADTLDVAPRQGIIKPFAQVEVTMNFTPAMPPPEKGFLHAYNAASREKKTFQRKAFIDCMEMNQRLNLGIEGSAQSADVAISPSMLRFGTCPVYDRRDILVTMVNKSDMRTPYNFTDLAHFKITPQTGVLEPHQNISIIVSFTPSQLGVFKNRFLVTYCNGLTSDEIKLVAEADKPGSRKLAGGTEALPQDFERIRKFVDPEDVRAAKERKKHVGGTKTYGKESEFQALLESSMDGRDQLYDGESQSQTSLVSSHPFKMRQENAKLYNNYLQKSHAKRLSKKTEELRQSIMAYRGVDPNDPTSYDFNMEHDLDEPYLKVPKGGEKLWLADSADNKRARPVLDENRLIMKKFSKTPSTQAEMRDCTMELNPIEISQITASHKVINFGRVCVGSSTTKSFSVLNELSGSAMVTLEELEPELRQSKPDAQVIPSGAVAGFDINFTSKTLGEYKKGFSWNLNGHHSFRVVVLAEVVPIEVEMSKTELKFEFSETSTESHLSQDIMLKNTGNANAEFLWGSSGAFECKPDKGSISPGQTAIISVVWSPAHGRRNEEELGLHIPGGVDKTLVVSGIVHTTKMVFDKPKVSFGTVAVGTEKDVVVRLVNKGQHAGLFYLEQIDERLGIRINPDRALVNPGEASEITVTIAPKTPMTYDDATLALAIRGLKPVTLKFIGESIIPEIEVGEKTIDIPNVAIGSEYRAPLALSNESEIAACLVIDLNKYQDFMPTIHDMDAGDQDSTKQYDSHHNCIELVEDKNNPNAPPSNTWKITLQPKSTLEGFLLFCPSIAKKYSFSVPIDIQGIEGNKALHCLLTASSSPSRLGMSTSIVDFGDCVVSRDPMNRSSYFSEVIFKSLDSSRGFSFEVKERPEPGAKDAALTGEAPTFFVSPVRGDLAPATKTSIRLTFQPQARGKYTKVLDVYITDQPSPDVPYFSMLCRGSGVYPSLTFSHRDVVLPTVPLDITSRTSFEIINQGYSSLVVSYKLSPSIVGKVDVEFPDGKEIGVTKTRLKVNVSSKSAVPMSWSGIIEFIDTKGEKFGVTVSGCSDNCLLTNSDYVRTHSSQFGFVGLENQPALYMLKSQIQAVRAEEQRRKEEIRKARQAARQSGGERGNAAAADDSSVSSKKKKKDDGHVFIQDLTADEDIPDESDQNSFNESEMRFCLRWLNRNVMDTPFAEENFPECVLENDGQLVIECIEALCGRKLTEVRKLDKEEDVHAGAVKLPGSSKSMGVGESKSSDEDKAKAKPDPAEARANKMLRKFRALLTVLTSNGALVTHVNAMNMMPMDDHVQAQITHAKVMEGSRLTPYMISEWKEGWKANWLKNCKQAWMDVLFQSIKVYVLCRVNYDELIKLPGFPQPTKPSAEPVGAPSKESKNGAKRKKKTAVPPELGRSNIYTQSECALLAWMSHHLNNAADLKDEGAHSSSEPNFGLKKRAVDFEAEAADYFAYCQLFHSHVPEVALMGGDLVGYTTINRIEDKEALFGKMLKMMGEFRLDFEMDETEVSASRRTTMLMVLHLYLNLPNMIPKAKVEFSGTLGKPVKKTIELRNPSKKPVKYQVQLQGCQDFALSAQEVEIGPQSSAEYLVTLNAKFFEPSQAKLTFWGMRQHGVAGRTIVFTLTSKMVNRAPIDTTRVDMCIFENKAVELMIANPFPKEVTMPIKLLYHHAPCVVDDIVGGRGFPNSGIPIDRSEEEATADEDYEVANNFRMPLWCNEESISLSMDEDEGPKPLHVNILPFVMGTYTCHLVFVDKRYGEFCYEIVVEAGLPKPVEHLGFDAVCSSTSQNFLSISAKNQAFEKALGVIIDSRMGNSQKKSRARSLLSAMLASPIDDDAAMTSTFNLYLENAQFKYPKTIAFMSEYVQQHPGNTLGGSKPTTAKKISKTELDGESAPHNGPNIAGLQFMPDKPGVYDSKIICWSKFNRHDIRTFKLTSHVKMPVRKLAIEFCGPALHLLEQEIPIHNETDNDWHLTATVTGRGFAGPKTFAVKAGMKESYILNFTGPALGEYEGTLVLKNSETNDSFEYTLYGVAETPLASEHLHFKAKARTNTRFSIFLNRNNKIDKAAAKKAAAKAQADMDAGSAIRTIKYNVDTDLQYVFGSDVAEVPTVGGDYEFSVMCPVSGIMSGSISFTDAEGFTVWYTMDVEVTAPQAESTIVVESVVRQAVSVEIGLENPLSEDLVFNVNIDGEGVFGDSYYNLPSKEAPGSHPPFELMFSPLHVGTMEGKVSFTNEKVGEIWYLLDLRAIEAVPHKAPTVECMLGSAGSIELPLENPLAEETVLDVLVSDEEHFSVKQDTITLDPFMQTTFDVFFRPSTLGDLVEGQVTLSGEGFGIVHYIVSGTGLMPGVMPDVEIVSPLGEFRSHVIPFRNPFNYPLPIDITMDEDPNAKTNVAPVFKLLMKQSEGVVVAPKSLCQLSLSFSPEHLGEYSTVLQVRAASGGTARSLTWAYPVRGLVEAGIPQYLDLLRTDCKTTLIREVEVYLRGLPPSSTNISLEDFHLEVHNDKGAKSQLARVFRVDLMSLRELSGEEKEAMEAPFAVVLRCLFEPLRVLSTEVSFVLDCKGVGRWRAQMEIESSEPLPDDKIHLIAPVDGTDIVKFRLSNRFLGMSNFTARFAPGSSSHFRVTPSAGVLAPFGSAGTEFAITFQPKVYGTRELANLVIETDDAQWNYECTGAYPDKTVDKDLISGKTDHRR